MMGDRATDDVECVTEQISENSRFFLRINHAPYRYHTPPVASGRKATHVCLGQKAQSSWPRFPARGRGT
jgi:hypothetical protein